MHTHLFHHQLPLTHTKPTPYPCSSPNACHLAESKHVLKQTHGMQQLCVNEGTMVHMMQPDNIANQFSVTCSKSIFCDMQ